MKKIHRVLAMLMAAVMALSLITTAFAEPTIDPGKESVPFHLQVRHHHGQ